MRRSSIRRAVAAFSLATASQAAAQTAPNPTLPVPVLSGPLNFGPHPQSWQTGALGSWYLDGATSMLGLTQTNASASDRESLADVANAMLFLQKIDGLVQFYAQAGAYALPSLGTAYTHTTDSADSWNRLYGPLPQAFIKIAPSENISLQAGKLPSLIGAEYSFTFENPNITRGLLWAQAPAVSRGLQLNAIIGPTAYSLSLNDGFYAGHYGWLSGSASWTIDAANQLIFAAAANLDQTDINTLATPRAQNNSAIYNIIYSYTGPKLTLIPYLQYSDVSAHPDIGIWRGAATYGAALLLVAKLTSRWSIGARGEIITSSTTHNINPPPDTDTNLLYGPASSATSFTLTPTYQHGHWFVRSEWATVNLINALPGDEFGPHGRANMQLRGLLECGFLF